MARGDERFAWALSFLDLFTCALGGVFMLTILSVRSATTPRPTIRPGISFSVPITMRSPWGRTTRSQDRSRKNFKGPRRPSRCPRRSRRRATL